jgi:hypothetical protein
MIGDIGQTGLGAKRVHEIHGAAAGDEEHATDALVGDESGDIIGETNGVGRHETRFLDARGDNFSMWSEPDDSVRWISARASS